MIIFNDFLHFVTSGGSDLELCSDALPTSTIADGAVLSIESKKVSVGGESFDTGANASKEEADEGTDDAAKTVINIVESHGLQKQEMDKKTYSTMQTAYWKALLGAINTRKNILVWGSEEKVPEQKTAEQKEEAKKRETAAVARMAPLVKKEYDEIVARFASYKKNFAALQKFVKDEVLPNFSEFDFYTAAEPAALGSCMIVPARFIGEATAPTFYFYIDGLRGEKA